MTGRRLPSRRLVLGGLAVVLVAWGIAALVSVLRARAYVEQGLDAIAAARRVTTPTDLVDGAPLDHLDESRRAFAAAERRLRNPVLAPLKVLPVLGRQLRATAALAGAAADVSDVGHELVGDAGRVLGMPRGTGPERIALLRALAEAAGEAERRLADVELGPSRALLAPLAERRAEVVDQLDEVRRAVHDGRVFAAGFADLLQGPTRYLLLAANNAEMRAGSGMFLSAGELTFVDGRFELAELRPTGDLFVENDPPAVPDADYAARWGWLNPNKEWRNLGLSPRFDATAALAARMWAATGGAPVHGVLALDPVALQAVLRGTGPVEVEGRTVSADNVVDLLLHDQYVGIEDITGGAQAGRREQLGLIAGATLQAVAAGRWDTGALAAGLAEAARQRHLLAWAADEDAQAMWRAARVDGRIERDSLLLAVSNRAGNKLDRFLHVEADLAFRVDGDDTAGELRVTLHNRTPAGESRYIAGPYPGSGVEAGDYFGLVSVTFPGFAGRLESDAGKPAAVGADGAARVLAVPVRVDRGTTKEVVFRFRVRGTRGALTVEPSARVPPVRWRAGDERWSTGEARRVTW